MNFPIIRAIPLLLAGSLASTPVWAQTPATRGAFDEDESVEALVKGEEAVRSGRIAEGYEILLAAWRKKKTFDIAANLGSVELRLGKTRDAAEHLAFSLREYPPSADGRLREKVQNRLALAKREVGALLIRVNVERADVIVDGARVGETPLPGEIFVEPGTRVVEAKLTGYAAARRTVDVQKGGSAAVELSLEPQTATSSPAPPVEQGSSPSRSNESGHLIGWVGIGLTAGAFASGIGFTLAANGKEDDISAYDRLGGTASCSGPLVPAQCEDLRRAVEARDAYKNLATASFIGAGVFGALTIGYFVLLPRMSRTAYRIHPLVGAQTGAVLEGSF